MGRGLLSFGAFLLVATIALWLAAAAGWISDGLGDQLSVLTFRSALVVVMAALVLRLLAPVTKQMAMGRCTVCGAPVERGHIYCLDHLQETVNAYRDRNRESSLPNPKRRA